MKQFISELKMGWRHGRLLGVADVLHHCGLLPRNFGKKICQKYENQVIGNF